jgi:hypothetical protein
VSVDLKEVRSVAEVSKAVKSGDVISMLDLLVELRDAADLLLAEVEGQGGTYGATRDAVREAVKKAEGA